jgi:hypothetical protein
MWCRIFWQERSNVPDEPALSICSVVEENVCTCVPEHMTSHPVAFQRSVYPLDYTVPSQVKRRKGQSCKSHKEIQATRFTTGENTGNHLVGGWVGQKSLSEDLEKSLLQLSGFEPWIVQPLSVTIPTTLTRKASPLIFQ